jgi:hypothetical protein
MSAKPCAHYFTRNRTRRSDFPSFFSEHDTGTERRSPLLLVWGSHNGKGVFLVEARTISVSPPSVIWLV